MPNGPPGPHGGRVRDGQVDPVDAGAAEFDPVEVHAALVGLLEEEAAFGLADPEAGGGLPFGHAVRVAVQERSVHGVEEVLDGVAPVDVPLRVAEEGRDVGVGELFRQDEGAGSGCSLSPK